MKKQPIPFLVLLTCVFSAFILGLFLGRNCFRPEVTLSALTTSPRHDTPIMEVTQPPETEPVAAYPIDINTASEAELQQLPGIGPELAGRIIQFRSANGPYVSPEELLNVAGVGPGRLETILDLITTGGNPQ